MAIAWVSQGTVGIGTTSVTPGLPASLADGDGVLIQVVTKPDTATVVTPTGWSLVADVAGGGGTTGAAVGPTRQVWLFREKDPSWSTMPAITVTSGSGTAAIASRYTKSAGTVWSFAASTGVYGTAATTTNGATTTGTNPGIEGGDLLVIGYSSMSVTPTWSAQNATVPGAPVSVGTERSEAVETTNGNDVGGMYYTVAVTSGTASGAPSTQATASAATRGTVAVVRLRESTPLPAFPAGDASSPATVKTTATANMTTVAFTPPANACIVVGVTTDQDNNAGGTPSISDSSGGRFTWTRVASSGHGGSGDVGLVALFAGVPTSPGTSPGSMTVTVNPGHTGSGKPRMVRTTVYTADVVDITDPVGAFVVGSFTSGTAVSASLTPETTGGGVRMMWLDWNATGVPTTTQANTVVVDSYHNAGLSTNLQLGKTGPTATAVAETIGATLLAAATDGNWIAYELRAPATGSSLTRSTTDAAVVSDTTARTRTQPRSTTDVVTAVDTLARAVGRSRAVSDAASVVDVTAGTVSRNHVRGTTDAAVASDGTSGVMTRARSTTDAAVVVDTLARSSSRSRTAVDSATATDSTTRTTSRTRSTTDAAATSDATAPSTTGNLSRSTTDAAVATDTTTRVVTRARATVDAAQALETTTRTTSRSRSTTDAAVVADTTSRSSIPRTRSTSDALTFTDTSSASTTGNLSRSVIDSAVVADTSSRRVTRTRSTTDAAAAADTTARRTTRARSTGELLTLVDLVTMARSTTRSLLESLTITDSTAAAFGLPFVDIVVVAVGSRQRHVTIGENRNRTVLVGTRQRPVVVDGEQRPVIINGRP